MGDAESAHAPFERRIPPTELLAGLPDVVVPTEQILVELDQTRGER